MQEIKTYKEGLKYIYSFIPKKNTQLFTGLEGLKTTKLILSWMNNPQDKIKVIHIAGTSGKGSTAFITSKILVSQGFKVGLQVSPFIEDIRERFEINNKLISEKSFVKHLNSIIPFIERAKSEGHIVNYFKLLVILAYKVFYEEKVDYAVIETGFGGLMDATNAVTSKSKVSVITQLGFDHTEILGNTIGKIAFQKAGIIQKQNQVISAWQHINARKVIELEAKKNQSNLFYVQNKYNFKNIQLTERFTQFDYNFLGIKYDGLKLGLLGKHQVQNASIALTTCLFLSKRDKFALVENKLRKVLENTRFKARFEIRRFQDKKIIIDGAHNPQKMQSFIKNLVNIFEDQKFVFLLAFKEGKNFKQMLDLIIPFASEIVISTFNTSAQDAARWSEEPDNIANYLKRRKFVNYKIFDNAQESFEYAKKQRNNIVITGSIYFIGSIYHLLPKQTAD